MNRKPSNHKVFPLLALTLFGLSPATPAAEPKFDETTRFIFYSVLEGLYDNGVSNEDVAQILMRNEGEEYFHFIYACPVCMATVWALDSYRGRPERFHSVKGEESAFGEGLEKEVSDALHSDDVKRRLAAINGLIAKWIERRMDKLNLGEKERESLLEELAAKRERGMEMLEMFRNQTKEKEGPGIAYFAPAHVGAEGWVCAACNAAVGKPMNFNKKEKKK